MIETGDDFAADTATTGKLTVGNGSNGTFSSAGDRDWFAVTLQAGLTYVFNFSAVEENFSTLSLTLNDPNGNQIGASATGSFGVSPLIEYTPTVGGTYFVQAQTDSTLGFYTLMARQSLGPDDFSADTATTGVLAAGATVSFNTEVDDHDWFAFHVEAGGHYAFEFAGPDATPTANLTMRSATGELFPLYSYPFEPAVAGDYFIDMAGYVAGAYTLKSIVLEDDFGAENQNAGAILAGGATQGAFQYQNDIDNFKVGLEAGYFYTFTLAATDGAGEDYIFLELRGANGNFIDSVAAFASQAATFTIRPTVDGDYFAVARMDTAGDYPVHYQVSVSAPEADDFGDTAATARAMQVGSTINGNAQSDDDVDMVKRVVDEVCAAVASAA